MRLPSYVKNDFGPPPNFSTISIKTTELQPPLYWALLISWSGYLDLSCLQILISLYEYPVIIS